MTKSIALLSAFLSVWLSAVARGQSGNDKVQLSALADVSAVSTSKPFWVGFKFIIDPGWHIYWKNPGDSGLATEVKLKLPEGFTAGEVQFPIPQRLPQPGDVVNYAYENQVMLMVQITPSLIKGKLPAESFKMTAKATWLVCKDDCMPGGTSVSLELPFAENASPANEELFKTWTARLPLATDTDDIAGSSASDSLTDGSGNASIKISWKKRVNDVQFIPGVMKTGDIADLKVATADNTTSINFNIKNKKDINPVTGLVTFTKTDGTKTALEISIPSTVPPKMEVQK